MAKSKKVKDFTKMSKKELTELEIQWEKERLAIEKEVQGITPLPKLTKEHICIRCLCCGKILASWSTHDYKTCGCPNGAMIDGGFSYWRCGAMDMSKVQMFNLVPIKES